MNTSSPQIELEAQLRNISWNGSPHFPASHYILVIFKILKCTNISVKLDKIAPSETLVHLKYTSQDTNVSRSFLTRKDVKGRKKDVIYSWLLTSAIFKSHCLFYFRLSIPLPAVWNTDGLVLETNDFFVEFKHSSVPSLDITQLASLPSRVTNLETQVNKLFEHTNTPRIRASSAPYTQS